MTSETLQLTEEMEKLSCRILADLTSTLVNLSGNLKDIECGTHIKIPTGAGYVSYYKSSDSLENLTLYLKQGMNKMQMENEEYQEYLDNYNIDDEGINNTKSDKL